jgi:hypothetical protein
MRGKMENNQSLARFEEFVAMGISGGKVDVDRLMEALLARDDLATSRLVDYALSLVNTRVGIARLKDYLFDGVQIQRNYAALYFKRKGQVDLLDDAVAQGMIDHEQAYSK